MEESTSLTRAVRWRPFDVDEIIALHSNNLMVDWLRLLMRALRPIEGKDREILNLQFSTTVSPFLTQ